MRPIVNSLTFIIFCLILCTACEETTEERSMTNTIRLDGWYNETCRISLNGNFTSLSFTFRDKYDELEIEDCVYIEADSKRVYPIQQTGDNYILDLKDVDMLFIKSIRPGKDWTPYSQEITLNNVMFHK
ncbi:MAG: hypothetical protein FWD60_05945 [Candidatus Azobacteroides sp.]|nr:hypothetical protein [Candidatus Azobacteroides sp.]